MLKCQLKQLWGGADDVIVKDTDGYCQCERD